MGIIIHDNGDNARVDEHHGKRFEISSLTTDTAGMSIQAETEGHEGDLAMIVEAGDGLDEPRGGAKADRGSV